MDADLDAKRAIRELETLLEGLTSTHMGRRAFLAGLPLLMSACATGDKGRYREGDNTGQETSLSVADEKRMANQVLPEIQKDYPVLYDAELQAYVSRVGQTLVASNGWANKPYAYSFTVVDVPAVNAFALPAGTIFVTAPLLEMTESEAELAGVLGHEIGHVKARHAAERIDQQERQKSNSWLYAIGGGALGAAAGFGVGKLLCPPSDDACMKTAIGLGAAAGIGGGLLVSKYKFLANSREDELEADRIGFRAAVQAGYQPVNVGDFYAKIHRLEKQSKAGGTPLLSSINDALSTHPPSDERVAQMSELANKSPKNSRAVRSTRDFEKAKKKVQAYLLAKKR